MHSWQKYRNYRKQESADGSLVFIITVDGTDVEVSEAVYREYSKAGRKMERMELDIKCEQVLKDASGKAVRDIHGNAVMLPEREVSLDKLVAEDWEFPSPCPSPEERLISSEGLEIRELRRCIALLSDDEQALIHALFNEGKPLREYAKTIGKSKSTVDRRKTKILGKLKISICFEN